MRRCHALRIALAVAALVPLTGCELDSFMNPSVSGYWEPQPTVLPILARIDAIESGDDGWGEVTDPTPDDLVPNDLSYRLVPGDFVTVQVFELYATGQWAAATRRIDPGGNLRAQELGDIPAAGRTPQELEDVLREMYSEIITGPLVEVVLEEGSGFSYTIYGQIASPGLYTLRDPDLRLMDALAVAGGVPRGIDSVFVIRQVELSDRVRPSFDRGSGSSPTAAPESVEPAPVNIDELLERMDRRDDEGGFAPSTLGWGDDDPPTIDVDDLEPVPGGDDAQVGVEDRPAPRPGSWVYIEERGEWVRVAGGTETAPQGPRGEAPLYAERIIRIPAEGLTQGRSSLNIVVRPDDRIYVEPPPLGVVYLDGFVNRPGPYNIPSTGEFTLSRAIAAAGGFNQLAIPERVDIIRIVGDNREAAISVNLGAIRQRTEPDILLKPDDHIIVGTNFWATPIAILRNGFRITYGFGFLLDRNFGNDVFGAPPTNVGNGR